MLGKENHAARNHQIQGSIYMCRLALVGCQAEQKLVLFGAILELQMELNCYTMLLLRLKVYRYGALVAVHVQVAGLAVDLVLKL
jgi:hypothetical protein